MHTLTSIRVFLGQVPLCMLAFAHVSVALPSSRDGGHAWRDQLGRIDFLGAAMLVSAILMLLIGLDLGAHHSWTSVLAIAPLATSLALSAAFVLVETSVALEPFAPHRIIFRPALLACFFCNFFSFGGYLSAMFYLPLFFQAVQHRSAGLSGVLLLPGIVGTVVGSLSAGSWMRMTGRYYRLTVFANAVLLLGLVLVFCFMGRPWSSDIGMSLSLGLSGLGNGISVTTTLVALIANVSAADSAMVTACSYLFRSLGSVVGLSVASAIVQENLQAQLAQRVDPGDVDRFLRHMQRSLDYVENLPPKEAAFVRESYQRAIQIGFGFCMAVLLAAWICSCKFTCLHSWRLCSSYCSVYQRKASRWPGSTGHPC